MVVCFSKHIKWSLRDMDSMKLYRLGNWSRPGRPGRVGSETPHVERRTVVVKKFGDCSNKV